MPETAVDSIPLEGQVKTCSVCHVVLTDSTTYCFIPGRDALVCSMCQSTHSVLFLPALQSQMATADSVMTDDSPAQRTSSPVAHSNRSESPSLQDSPGSYLSSESFIDSDTAHHYPSNFKPPSSPHVPPTPFHLPTISTSTTQPVSNISSRASVHVDVPSSGAAPSNTGSSAAPGWASERLYRVPDISTPDITDHRLRSQAYHCLYPGSIFQGEQKSGKTSYDVTVTIVDVDFSSSFLCGYLTIRNLTEEFPELTTYFDAEIIGSRHGFLTPNSLAEEKDDLKHWERFPAFRHVKSELRQPRLTMPDRDRGAVFMRWKERFLVPDHRVENISGASFAGFYYVCVDFNPAPPPPPTAPQVIQRSFSQSVPDDPEEEQEPDLDVLPLPQQKETSRRRRGSSNRRGDAISTQPRVGLQAATMTGFYHHKNSEPYQRLSLTHVPSASTSTFEFC